MSDQENTVSNVKLDWSPMSSLVSEEPVPPSPVFEDEASATVSSCTQGEQDSSAPMFSSQTNKLSRINSIFYGAHLNINNLNVYVGNQHPPQ